MLNKISTICSSVFLILAFIAPGFADEHFPFLAEVSKESVNVRAGPNTNFDKIDKLSKGDKIVVLGRSYEWYKVQPAATTKAYIRTDYLNIIKGGAFGVVLGDNVNVRSSANSDAASLGEVKKGTLVKVVGQENGWCRLGPVAGTAAWIHQDFLKEISADVPASLLIQKMEGQPVVNPEGPLKSASSGVSSWVSMRGTVEALVQPSKKDVHYEIVLDNKSVFYLQDIPQLSFFCNTVVDVEGALIPDPQKKSMYPVLHISRIALVLRESRESGFMVDVLLLIVFVVVPAIVLHEYAHGLSAYLLGDSTAKNKGRLTLNPIKHIDPVGSLLVPGVLFLAHYFGLTKSLMLFGWAKPVPVNFRNLRPPRLGMALVAIAGPLTNIALAFIFSKLYVWPALSNASQICAWGVMLNLTLAVFNMMPIPPLDGSRIVTSLLPTKMAYYYSRLEPFGIIILVVLLNFGMLGFLSPMIEQVGYWIGVQL